MIGVDVHGGGKATIPSQDLYTTEKEATKIAILILQGALTKLRKSISHDATT
jgi:hypothetical protein